MLYSARPSREAGINLGNGEWMTGSRERKPVIQFQFPFPRPVSWLAGSPTAFPPFRQWLCDRDFERRFTVAGQLPVCTGFPIIPEKDRGTLKMELYSKTHAAVNHCFFTKGRQDLHD
jgi:hypothetical protein